MGPPVSESELSIGTLTLLNAALKMQIFGFFQYTKVYLTIPHRLCQYRVLSAYTCVVLCFFVPVLAEL
jgi:hypothetical protein